MAADERDVRGINDRAQLAAVERIVQRAQRRRADASRRRRSPIPRASTFAARSPAAATCASTSAACSKATSRWATACSVGPYCVLRDVDGRRRARVIAPFSHLDGATIGAQLPRRAVRAAASRRRARRRRARRQLRRGQGEHARTRRARPITSPTSATRPSARDVNFGAGVDHRQLRRREQAPHGHRRRRAASAPTACWSRRSRSARARRSARGSTIAEDAPAGAAHAWRARSRSRSPAGQRPVKKPKPRAQGLNGTMCGIVGAVVARNVVPILIEGIRRLEYRGYDSTGLAVINGGATPMLERLVSHGARRRPRRAGRCARSSSALTGISHTRWATHGAPSPVNAHPHTSDGEVAVVHNGIIENYEALRERLQGAGLRVPHADRHRSHRAPGARALARRRQGDLLRAVQLAVAEFHGAYAIAVISTREPGRVVGARAGQPAGRRHRRGRPLPRLRCGRAGVGHAARRLSRGRRRRRRPARVLRDLRCARAARRARRRRRAGVGGAAVELGPYRHFMQKEIFEQPRAVADTLEAVGGIDPTLFGADAAADACRTSNRC